MYNEDDLIPLSGLQHILFCERQCALIHIEQVWVENFFTAQGKLMHERVDQPGHESRKDVRIEYAVPLRSLALGLSGIADVVEFHRCENGIWYPYPVEYKRGRPKKENWDRVQLCAQALCLEEMLEVEVAEGALFYGKNRRRKVVVFDGTIRKETRRAALALHDLIASGMTPTARYKAKCDTCSLVNVCLPRVATGKKSVTEYVKAISEQE